MSSPELLAACDEVISPELLTRAISRVGWPHRERILTPAIMLMGLLRMIMLALPSFMRLVDHMRRGGLGAATPVTDSAFYKRLGAMPHDLFRAVLQEVTAFVRVRGLERKGIRELAPWADAIMSVDDTTLDALARKTAALQKHAKGAVETLAGRLSCAIDLRTGLIAEVLYDPNAATNEKPHFGELLKVLGTNKLFVFDLGYFAFPLFDRLTESGNFFVTRLRKGTSYLVVARGRHTDFYRESLIYLGKHRADRAAHPVRLVEMLIGAEWHQYLTNVMDPTKLPADAVWKLYRERWGIESVFAVLKQNLKLAFIRPCHINGVLAQVWSTLTVYQLLQDLRLRAGVAHKCGCDKISWYNLVARLEWYVLERSPLSLADWLLDTSRPLLLEKRGQRQRVPSELTGRLARDLKEPPVSWDIPPRREARQGKPETEPDLTRTRLAGLQPG